MNPRYLQIARHCLAIKHDGAVDEIEAERVARGLDRLLHKTFSVGHGGGGAPAQMSGGAALAADPRTVTEHKDALKRRLAELKALLDSH